MKILITNDDGVNSPGLQVLKKVVSRKHEVWVLAPSRDRSGVSQSITLREPVKIQNEEENVWSCSGTPTDCVVYGTGGFFPVKFDLILSGINIGPNVGTDLIYSGTAAAARQAVLHDIPGIALSVDKFQEPFPFAEIAEYVLERLEELHSQWDSSFFYNMNFPPEIGCSEDLVWTRPGRRKYHDEVVQMKAPRGEAFYCFLKGNIVSSEDLEGTDVFEIKRGRITLSAVSITPAVVSHVGDVPKNMKAGQ